jgi:hypothetical protein
LGWASVETYPAKRRRKQVSVGVVIELLESENHLIDLLLQDLNDAKARATSTPAARYSAMEQITIRLSFLEYLLSSSTLSPNTTQIDTLWNCLVVNAANDEERETFFRWLDKARGEPAREGFMV